MIELFFQENIALIALLLFLIGFLIYDITIGNRNGPKKVQPMELPMLQREDIFLLDVSPDKAFERGYIDGSINIPAKKFAIGNKKFKPKSKDQTIVVIDQNGLGHGSVTSKLVAAGYSKIRILDGGIASWKSDNYPLVSK